MPECLIDDAAILKVIGEAGTMGQEKILIVCDRGTIDNKAYMAESEFDSILVKLGTDEIHLRDNYDAVFHLVTAARGAV